MTSRSLAAAALAVAVVALQHPTNAAKPSGSVVELGTLGGGFSDAFGVNNAPSTEVVGRSTRADGFLHAFFWTGAGPMVDLGTLRTVDMPAGVAGNSYASDINDHGLIAGGSWDGDRQQRAVVWSMVGGGWNIEDLGTLTGSCCANANGLNNGGGVPDAVAVVGNSATSTGALHATVWRKSGTAWVIEDLGTVGNDMSSSAHDVNDEGTIVGVSEAGNGVGRGFMKPLGLPMVALPGLGGDTHALAISNNGDVAGVSTDSSGNVHAVRWRFNMGVAELDDLGTLGGCCSAGFGINAAGDVVGFSSVGKRQGTQRAFIAAPTAAMVALGGARGQSAARDLNDHGVVVGGSGGGQPQAVIWRRQ